ncbi:MAG: alpha/beta hydrolase-fold protein [Pseudomonadales bacterium]
MRKRPSSPRGQLVTLRHDSRILADNPLGDPHERDLPVWLPPGYRATGKRHYPVLFDLTGFTGAGPAHVGWKAFDENVPERLERLTATKHIGPMIVVFPDCFTSLGGNQYINSTAIGAYADYLTRELIPTVDREFATHADRDHRGCFGKSSGGYGAMLHGMRYARHWGAIANHSGDAYFDFVYRSEWPGVLTELTRFREPRRRQGSYELTQEQKGRTPGEDDGRVRRFLDSFFTRKNPGGKDIMVVMMLCMAASYDPDPKAPNGFRLPFDLESGEFLPQRWRRWLNHDPVRLVGRYAKNLRTLRGIFIDCGWQDQYHIHFGSRQLSAGLTRHGIEHRYEEFQDNHSGIDYRMDESLPYLYRALR